MASRNIPKSSKIYNKVEIFFCECLNPFLSFRISRILEALSPETDNVDDHDDVDSLETASIIISSSGRPPSAISGTRVPKYESYRARLAPLIELEDRLTRLLSSPDEEEPTHLPLFPRREDPIYTNRNGFAPPALPVIPTNGVSRGRPAPTILIPPHQQSHPSPVSPLNGTSSTPGSHSSSPSTSSSKSRGKEVSVHVATNWKKPFALAGKSKSPKTEHGGEIEGWWVNPEDPVHVLHAYAPAMTELWRDPKVRQRLREKRLRLEESSGLYAEFLKHFLRCELNDIFDPPSYLDDIPRITAKKYIPTDGCSLSR